MDSRDKAIRQIAAKMHDKRISLMRWLGYTNIAAACRYFSARPWDALKQPFLAMPHCFGTSICYRAPEQREN